MPTRAEQAQVELRRRAAQAELDRRNVPTFPGGAGGEFSGRGATGEWEPEAPFAVRAMGAVAKGEMAVGQALLRAPAMAVKQYGLVRQFDMANAVLRETDPERQAMLREQMADSEQIFDKVANWLNKPAELHKIGRKIIEQNHPEWESDPPKNFVDLLTNPDKLGIAIAESMPVLVNAGILTLAGQPNLASGLMYVAEGQQAYDQAIQDGASEDDAVISYAIYGSVSAALEKMQLEGILKITKGSYNALLNRTVQKVAGRGLRHATWGVIKLAAQEGLEELSQGAWQEITAKLVYDKSVPGGVAGFIDRRAQEAYLGFMIGLIPGVTGGVAGVVKGRDRAGVERVTPTEPTPVPTEAVSGQPPVTEAVEGVEKPVGVEKVYRGTGGTLEMAETATEGKMFGDKGVYFSKQKKYAKYYGKTKESTIQSTAKIKVIDQNKYQGYTVESPFAKEVIAETGKFTKKAKNDYLDILEKQGYDGLLIKNVATGIPDVGDIADEYIIWNENVITPTPQPEPKPTQPRMSRRKLLKLGHTLPDVLEWDEAQRRDFMQQTVGKSSMKRMTLKEMKVLVTALQGEMRKAGLEYAPEPSPVDELVDTLQTKKVTELEPAEELNRGRVRQLGRKIKSGVHSFVTGLERMERFFEGLDGHKKGTFTKNIWEPVKNADELSTENANQELNEFTEYLASQDIDSALWLGKVEQIGNTKWSLTPFQKIGVYTLSLNKNGRRQLTEGMGFSESDLAQIIESITPQEKAVAEWLLKKYDQQWDTIKTVAIQSGMDPTKLKKELHYSPIIRTDADLEAQEDFLSGLSDAFTGEAYDPEHKFLEPRKPSTRGRVELDAAILYTHNIARTQRFLQMAPVANRIGRILNNRKFKAALNERTYGQGSKLVNKWMKDAVRGTVAQDVTDLSKMANIMRRNGIVYAIGFNIPSSLRQSLSLSNAVAVDKAMLRHVPVNLAKGVTPKGYKQMEEFVFARSLQVKNSSFDRDLRTKANKAGLKLKLRGKKQWSQKAIGWIRWMDRHTRVVAWKSLYDTGMGKFSDEAKASEYADKWVARTQPMANMKDLPHFFRGSAFEKLLTTFQNQVNNNANFYMYDILGAKKAGEITLTEAGHRVMFSYVLPAVLFGMIGRGGLPKDIKDVAVDLVTYPIAGAVVIGRWITQMIRGWGDSSTIAEAAPKEFQKFVGAVKRGDIQNIIKYAATVVGAATGRIPAQAVRTAEGIVDIATGETQDPRRLIYSEWALKQGWSPAAKKSRYSGGYI